MKQLRVLFLTLSYVTGIGAAGFILAGCGHAGTAQSAVTVDPPASASSPTSPVKATPSATSPVTTVPPGSRLPTTASASSPPTTTATAIASPTTTTSPATTATTATTAPVGSAANAVSPDAVSPDVVPTTITPAYVDAVLVVLNHIYGNATRLMVATNTIPLQIPTDLRAIFADPEYGTQIEVFSVELDQGFSDVRKPLGDRVITVVRILSTSPGCIYVQDHTTFEHTSVDPVDDPYPQYLALETKSPADDPNAINPTPWAISYDVSFAGPASPPPNPCAP